MFKNIYKICKAIQNKKIYSKKNKRINKNLISKSKNLISKSKKLIIKFNTKNLLLKNFDYSKIQNNVNYNILNIENLKYYKTNLNDDLIVNMYLQKNTINMIKSIKIMNSLLTTIRKYYENINFIKLKKKLNKIASYNTVNLNINKKKSKNNKKNKYNIIVKTDYFNGILLSNIPSFNKHGSDGVTKNINLYSKLISVILYKNITDILKDYTDEKCTQLINLNLYNIKPVLKKEGFFRTHYKETQIKKFFNFLNKLKTYIENLNYIN